MPTDEPSTTHGLRRRGRGHSAALLLPLLRPLPLTAALCLCLYGCNALPPTLPVMRAEQAAPTAASTSGQAVLEPRYLRFKADDTQLGAVQDDGRYTYLEFSSPVEADLELFDQDGGRLESARAGRVVAVRGLHQGILVRRGTLASFVSPNPRGAVWPRPPLAETAAHAEVRARLDNHEGQLQAMQRALDAARLAMASGGRDAAARAGHSRSPADAGPSSLQQSTPQAVPPRFAALQGATAHAEDQAARASDPGLPEVVYASPPATATPRPQPPPWLGAAPAHRRPWTPPLAAANASVSVPERGLIRVFFATASRAIVAPEDGLALLLREAANADEIRVTGFTDATGSRAANDALAQARADAVVQILLRRGIASGRIFSSAVGADEYIADNASEHGRALNRRVEVLLLKDRTPMQLGSSTR